MKERVNGNTVAKVLLAIVVALFVMSFASAGFSDWFNKITGRATSQTVSLNISVANNAPLIYRVNFSASTTPSENTYIGVSVNFSASDADGAGNLDDATARINITRGSQTRANYTCTEINSGGNDANYSCFVDVWYFDESGYWNVTVTINDTSASQAQNTTSSGTLVNFTVNTLTAFVMGPSALTFASLALGAVNSTSNNDPLLLNNTGNVVIANGSIQVNSTDLDGETVSSLSLYARNFSMGAISGVECNAINSTLMNRSIFQYIELANLSRGNNSINNGATGQEQTYLCLRIVGNELSSQAYSTTNEGAWTVKVA